MVIAMPPVLTSPLVSTQWLADHLGSDELVVVDASVVTSGTGRGTTWTSGIEHHRSAGHVRGAVFADLLRDFSAPDGPTPFTRPDAAAFERAAGALGITNDTTVVVYDDDLGQWAARLWWLFRSFGFDTAAVLDGGFRKWTAERRPIDLAASVPTSEASFLVAEDRPVWADRDRVVRAADGTDPAALVCAADDTDLGTDHPPIVPGSTTIPARAAIDEDTNAYLRRPALERVFEPVLSASEVVTYCGVGTAACVDALALTMLGHARVRVYDGSLADWWREPDAVAI
jgi:thiosulfate/3-mercaptopyruvate sulfurtransferase